MVASVKNAVTRLTDECLLLSLRGREVALSLSFLFSRLLPIAILSRAAIGKVHPW